VVREHGVRAGYEPATRLLTEAACWQLADSVVRTYDGDMTDVSAAPSTVVDAVLHLAGDLAEHLRTPDDVAAWTGRFAAPPSGRATAAAELRARLDLGERPVVLRLSAKRPHKNLMALVEAVAGVSAEHRPVLVVPGYPTPHEAELRERAAALGVAADVRFLDWVSSADLEGLYRLASVFVYPSLYEGFGLPVLEAMARELPVACSDRGALREVAGDAAHIFDPESPEAIAKAIEDLQRDDALVSRLRAAGRERANRFTWAETARATLSSYAAALGSAT